MIAFCKLHWQVLDNGEAGGETISCSHVMSHFPPPLSFLNNFIEVFRCKDKILIQTKKNIKSKEKEKCKKIEKIAVIKGGLPALLHQTARVYKSTCYLLFYFHIVFSH